MSDVSYVHLVDLDQPEKPWRRVWRCPATGVFVKTHAKRRNNGLGKLVFDITASACDEDGKALRRSDGAPAVLGSAEKPLKQLLIIASDRAPSDMEPVAEQLNRQLRFMVAKVENAMLIEQQAPTL